MEQWVSVMPQIYWLTNEDITHLVKVIAAQCEKEPNPVLDDVLKELGVAQARAESSRILGIKFKKSIGKTNSHIPIKLKTEELKTIKTLGLDTNIRGLL